MSANTADDRAATDAQPRAIRRRAGLRPSASVRATLYRTAFVAFLLAVWELLGRTGVLDTSFTSMPSSIFTALGGELTSGSVAQAVVQTLESLALAFVIGAACGILFGVAIGLQSLLRDAYFPVITLLIGIPKSVFLPLLIIFFGLGIGPGIAFGALLCFLYVVVNVVSGLDLIEPKYHDVATAFGSSPWGRFVHVVVPAAAPGIFAGLWHGLRSAFNGVLIAQLFVSTVGIGNLVRIYTNNLRTDQALALEFLIAVAVILIGSGWSRIETRLQRWRGQ